MFNKHKGKFKLDHPNYFCQCKNKGMNIWARTVQRDMLDFGAREYRYKKIECDNAVDEF